MKIDSKTMFGTFRPWRLFFMVALPGMVSMFAMSAYSILEGTFVGHKLGESAFAAINIALPVVMINFSLADMIGVGASVPISVSLGKKDEKTANNFFSSSVVMIFVTALLMGLILLFFAEPLVRMMGADDTTAVTAARYVQTFAVCGPICTLFFAMDNYLRISGYVRMSMFINIFSNALTISLLLLFIFVLELGVIGSALASCISMCTCTLIALIPFVRNKALLKFVKPRFSIGMMKQIVTCGSPVFLSNIAGRITSVLINITLMTLGVKYLGEGGGTTAVATYGVLMYANEMCQPLLYGMGDSLSPALGFNWGAKQYDRVKKIAKCGYIGSFVVSIVATGIMFFLARPLATLFVDSKDMALLELATGALRIFSIAYTLRWFVMFTQSFLSAIEKPVHATILSVSVALVFPIIVLGVLWNMGLDGVWLNMFGTCIPAVILGVILLLSVFKKIKTQSEVVSNDNNDQ